MQKKNKMEPMKPEKAAAKAVFEMQMNTKEPIRFVERRARVDEKTAKKAIEDAPDWYKNKDKD